nr:hemerythrin domain-containing protein [uncultured Desulfobacter sp.]
MEEAGLQGEGSPIGVLLSEHDQGRKLVARLKDAVTNYKAVDKMMAATARMIIHEYVDLLTQHIAKENTVLFPMADAKLDSKKDAELVVAFAKLEHDRIGAGKHDEFHSFLDQLQNEFLK